jgi:hypothetical protein
MFSIPFSPFCIATLPLISEREGRIFACDRCETVSADRMRKLAIELTVMLGLLLVAAALLGSQACAQVGPSPARPSWDVVVLGRIDACWVCQFRPAPHVSYTQVLAGKVPNGQPTGKLAVAKVAEKLLPEGKVPIYRSEKEEICFLKRVEVPGSQAADVYEVVDVMEATPENLARFRSQ